MKNGLSLLFAIIGLNVVIAQDDASLEMLTNWMTGSFNSEAQSIQDTSYLNISLEITRIWSSRMDGQWIYVEQALASKKDTPYRQRIYHLQSDGKKNHFSSEVFDIPNKEKFIGAYKKPRLFNELNPEEIIPLNGCTITMVYTQGEFIGSTAEVCENKWGGAAYASSEVRITQKGMESWDRGWDDLGKQVWGAEKAGYMFIKLK